MRLRALVSDLERLGAQSATDSDSDPACVGSALASGGEPPYSKCPIEGPPGCRPCREHRDAELLQWLLRVDGPPPLMLPLSSLAVGAQAQAVQLEVPMMVGPMQFAATAGLPVAEQLQLRVGVASLADDGPESGSRPSLGLPLATNLRLADTASVAAIYLPVRCSDAASLSADGDWDALAVDYGMGDLYPWVADLPMSEHTDSASGWHWQAPSLSFEQLPVDLELLTSS